jgi:hypothetical protein
MVHVQKTPHNKLTEAKKHWCCLQLFWTDIPQLLCPLKKANARHVAQGSQVGQRLCQYWYMSLKPSQKKCVDLNFLSPSTYNNHRKKIVYGIKAFNYL